MQHPSDASQLPVNVMCCHLHRRTPRHKLDGVAIHFLEILSLIYLFNFWKKKNCAMRNDSGTGSVPYLELDE